MKLPTSKAWSSLSLRDLQYIVTLAQLRHFGQAAEACHVSQPALSAQVKKIEELLGVPLFERTNRKVALTEVGSRVAEQALRVLEEASKLEDVASPSRALLTGKLRFGVIASVGPYWVPKFLAPLRKAYPDLQLVLREGLTEQLLEELRDGELDLILAAQTFSSKGLHLYPFAFESFWLALPQDHPLASKTAVRASDLRTDDMVLLEDGHCLRDQVIELCPVSHRGKVRQYHAVSLETVRYLVAAGAGYTLMPRLAVPLKKTGRDGMLTYRELEGREVGRKLVLACRDQFPRLKDVRELVSFLKKWSEAAGLGLANHKEQPK